MSQDQITLNNVTIPLLDEYKDNLDKRIFLTIKEYNKTATNAIPLPKITSSQKEEFRYQEHPNYRVVQSDPQDYEVLEPTQEEIQAAMYQPELDEEGNVVKDEEGKPVLTDEPKLDANGNKLHYNEPCCKDELIYQAITAKSMQRLNELYEAGDYMPRAWHEFKAQLEIEVEEPALEAE